MALHCGLCKKVEGKGVICKAVLDVLHEKSEFLHDNGGVVLCQRYEAPSKPDNRTRHALEGGCCISLPRNIGSIIMAGRVIMANEADTGHSA